MQSHRHVRSLIKSNYLQSEPFSRRPLGRGTGLWGAGGRAGAWGHCGGSRVHHRPQPSVLPSGAQVAGDVLRLSSRCPDRQDSRTSLAGQAPRSLQDPTLRPAVCGAQPAGEQAWASWLGGPVSAGPRHLWGRHPSRAPTHITAADNARSQTRCLCSEHFMFEHGQHFE